MRNSTHFLLAAPLVSAFAAIPLSAVADNAKPAPKAPTAQQGNGAKMGSTGSPNAKDQHSSGTKGHNEKGGGTGSTGKGQASSHGEGQAPQQSGGQIGSSAGDLVGGIVGGAVGGLLSGTLGGR